MERYRTKRPQLIVIATILSVLVAAAIILIVLRALDKLEISNQVDDREEKTAINLECFKLCPEKPVDYEEKCCDESRQTCQDKQVCFDKGIDNF